VTHPSCAVAHTSKPTHTVVFQFLGGPAASADPLQALRAPGASVSTSGVWSPILDMTPDKRQMVPVGKAYFLDGKSNKQLFYLGRLKDQENVLAIYQRKADVILLFAAPKEAAGLQLQFGDGAPVPLPTTR